MRYEIRERGIGEILDQAIVLFRNHFKLFFTLVLYIAIPFGLVQGLLIHALAPEMGPDGMPSGDAMLGQGLALAAVGGLFGLLGFFLVQPITMGALIWSAASEFLGRPVEPRDALRYGFRRFPAIVGANLVVAVFLCLAALPGGVIAMLMIMAGDVMAVFGVLLGILAALGPVIYLAFRFYFVIDALVIEEVGIGQSLTRSGILMKGNYSRAFVLGLIVGVIGLFVYGMANLPVPLVPVILQTVLGNILFIFGVAVSVVFYFSARCQHENFDLSVLAGAMEEGEGAGTGEEETGADEDDGGRDGFPPPPSSSYDTPATS